MDGEWSDELDVADLVDFDVLPSEVLQRIDDLIAAFFSVLASGDMLTLELVHHSPRMGMSLFKCCVCSVSCCSSPFETKSSSECATN